MTTSSAAGEGAQRAPGSPFSIAKRTRHLPGFVPVPPYPRSSAAEIRPALSEETKSRLLALAITGLF